MELSNPEVIEGFISSVLYVIHTSLVIGQVKTNEKSNEITAIPELLDMIYIEGCIVTMVYLTKNKNAKALDLIKKSFLIDEIFKF